jgi:hypothetical protein
MLRTSGVNVVSPAQGLLKKLCQISKIVPSDGESSAGIFLPLQWTFHKLLIFSKQFSPPVFIQNNQVLTNAINWLCDADRC